MDASKALGPPEAEVYDKPFARNTPDARGLGGDQGFEVQEIQQQGLDEIIGVVDPVLEK